MRISLVFLGQTGAGPVYSLEFAKALSQREDCSLQVIISSSVSNLEEWNFSLKNTKVDYHIIDTYKRTKTSVLFNQLNIIKQEKLVNLIEGFKSDVLYIPFGLMWARYVYWRLHKSMCIITTLHDVEFHDSWRALSVAELGSYLLNYGSKKFVHAYVVLNRKDLRKIENKSGKPVCVIPHASFGYYFKNDMIPPRIINKCIGFFGRIEEYKGLDVLVESFEKTTTKDLKLLIAGSGKISTDLHDRISSNSNIELINRYIKDDEFEGLLNKVDISVLPYKRASQSGVIPMCFAAGRTVIATNVGALSEQVPVGTGILTKLDPVEIAKVIDDMYLHPERILEYGMNAKKYADTELTWDHSAKLLIDFCNSVHNRQSVKMN